MLDIEPARDFPAGLDLGVVGAYKQGDETAFELRALFPDHTGALREDPVTGSLNASVAQWLLSSGHATAPYVASQGVCVGHAGRVNISQDDDGTVWVGGGTLTLMEGDVTV